MTYKTRHMTYNVFGGTLNLAQFNDAVMVVVAKQVLTLQHQYVGPAGDDLSEMRLTEECKTLTGLCDDLIRNAQPLDHVLDDVSNVIIP